MALPQYTGAVNYISILANKVTGSATTLKSSFDKFGSEFKAWFNGAFLTALNAKFITEGTPYGEATSDDTNLTATITGVTLTDGQGVCIKVTAVATNVDTVKININGLGLKQIYCNIYDTSNGNVMNSGALIVDAGIYTMRYWAAGDSWIIQ